MDYSLTLGNAAAQVFETIPLMHHGDLAAAEVSLIKANQIYQDNHASVLRYLAGTQLRLGKTDMARSAKQVAANQFGITISGVR